MLPAMTRLAASIALLLACSTVPAVAAKPPNVLLLLADDLGWTGLGCFGSDFYETPHLDALAKRGVTFTNAYAACTVCSPTRAALMTGQYPARLRLTDFIAGQNRPFAKMRVPAWTKGLAHEHTTLAEALRGAGYRTAHVGKWHLNRPKHVDEDSPTKHGFDSTYDRPPGTRGYQLSAKVQQATGNSYLTDLRTDKALAFLDGVEDQPFFLYMAYNVPHTPIQGHPDLVDAFQAKVNPEAVHHNPIYAAMVKSLDDSVGRLLDKIDQLGKAEDTLVIFTSDNGGLTQRYGKHDEFTENLPLRRGKGSAYEGGVRVPTLVHWPGVTPTTGAECATPIMSIDFLPTLTEITTQHSIPGPIDGRSLVPLLKDPAKTLDRDLFWHYPHYHAGGDGPYSAIRSGDWRLVEFHEDRRCELYHLGDDLGEQQNLAATHPERVDTLRAKLHAWRTSVGAQMPLPNPDHDPARETEVARRKP